MPYSDDGAVNWDVLEDAQFIFENGGYPPDAARRIGVSIETIQRNYTRANVEFPFFWVKGLKKWQRRIYSSLYI